MTRAMIRGWGVLAATLTFLGSAQAESAHWVRIRTQPSTLRVRVTAPDGTRTRACTNDCVLNLSPGAHRVQVFDADGGSLGERSVNVDRATTWVVSPPPRQPSAVGYGLVIAGGALIVVGAALALPLVLEANCHSSDGCLSDGERTAGHVGLGALLAGAVLIPIGASSRATEPVVDVGRDAGRRTAPTAAPGLRLQLELAF